jgi:hypothetical protein
MAAYGFSLDGSGASRFSLATFAEQAIQWFCKVIFLRSLQERRRGVGESWKEDHLEISSVWM